MFVFEPSRAVFSDMMKKLGSNPPTPFAEQDFLNTYFRESYKPIPMMYNLVLAMLWRHRENVDLDSIKIVHYCAKGSKPWAYNPAAEHMDMPEVKHLVDAWWNVYMGPGLSSLKADITTGEINGCFPLADTSGTISSKHCKLLGLKPNEQSQQTLMKAGTAA
jgi:inositol 3-alpha-galactosyltransferase